MFTELKNRIQKNIDRAEASLADLRKQLEQVNALEQSQRELPLAASSDSKRSTK